MVRTYSWIVVLGNNGFVNVGAAQARHDRTPLQLMFTVTGVTIALVHVTLPVMVIMLAAALAHIDPDYEKAAESLGAGPIRAFLTVTLPLSMPGIMAGMTTAFAWTFSAFATPQLIGGGKVNMVSNLVYQLGFANFNFPFAASLSVAALALTFVSLALMRVLMRPLETDRAALHDAHVPIASRARRCRPDSLVVAILGFLILPAAVVAIAAFNDKALLAFPPESCRCAGSPRRSNYRDFRLGFCNGLIVTFWASTIALVVGAAFAFVLDRYQFRAQAPDRSGAARAADRAALHRRARLSHAGRAGRRHARLWRRHRLPRRAGAAVRPAQRLHLAAQSRRSHGAGGCEPRRAPGRVLFTVTLPLLLPGLVSGWLFAAILSFNEFTASLFVTAQRTQTLPVAMYNYVREYADPTMAASQRDLHRRHRHAAGRRQRLPRSGKGPQR